LPDKEIFIDAFLLASRGLTLIRAKATISQPFEYFPFLPRLTIDLKLPRVRLLRRAKPHFQFPVERRGRFVAHNRELQLRAQRTAGDILQRRAPNFAPSLRTRCQLSANLDDLARNHRKLLLFLAFDARAQSKHFLENEMESHGRQEGSDLSA
jgi:hypothetical protein